MTLASSSYSCLEKFTPSSEILYPDVLHKKRLRKLGVKQVFYHYSNT